VHSRGFLIMKNKTFAFIDASNLFYGGEKSLGWKIDYQKLLAYLKKKYGASKAFYFGGVETHDFNHNYDGESVDLDKLKFYLSKTLKSPKQKPGRAKQIRLENYLQRVKFYLKLDKFGYELVLKPVKLYRQDDQSYRRKANCDVDMAFYMMKELDNFQTALILSGDGDFLPVLKYLKKQGKTVIVLARGPRTAREIRQFAGENFRDFVRLENFVKFSGK